MIEPGTRRRLGTAFLLLTILVLGLAVVAQHRRETRLRQALALFRNQAHQVIYERLEGLSPPVGSSPRLSLRWGATAPLEELIRQIEIVTTRRSRRPRWGFSIAVDSAGLKEAGQSLTSLVQLPKEPGQDLSLDAFMHQTLGPMNLAYEIRDGALLITSRQTVERSHERILKLLDQPILLTWSSGTSLEDVLKAVRSSTLGPEFPLGLPIYPDPSLAKDSEPRAIIAPSPKEKVPMWEHLVRILSPLRMRYELRNGAIIILKRPKADEPAIDQAGRLE